MTRDQFLNIVAFLTLMSNEFAPEFFIDKSPEYIIEKWARYIGGPPPAGPCWEWGLTDAAPGHLRSLRGALGH